MTAAVCGHADVMRLLAEEEGGPKDSRGRTALVHAAHNKHPECVRLLREEEKVKRASIVRQPSSSPHRAEKTKLCNF